MVCGEETAPHAEAVQMADQQGRVNDETATTEVRTGSMQNNAPKNDPDDLEGSGDEEGDRGIVTSDPSMLPEIKKRKKKKNTKSKGKRGIGKPTGMEEFYADAPLTAEEYAEQQTAYNPSLPLLDRLLAAVQRFERTRKLTPERRDRFYKWLHYGGIKISPNVGQGKQNLEGMDSDEVAATLSQALISDELRQSLAGSSDCEPKYVVDFLGCMRGFLSRSAPAQYALDTKEDVELLTTTLERFQDFLLQREVCPEYRDEVMATRDFCRQAAKDMWACAQAERWLPGTFNIACSTLTGSKYARDYDGETYWGDEKLADGPIFVGLKQDEADLVFRLGLMGGASEEVWQTFEQNTAQGMAVEIETTIKDHGFEIMQIQQPTTECKEVVTQHAPQYRPVGKIFARPWQNPEYPPDDLTEEEKKSVKSPATSQDEYEFLIEDDVLKYLAVGQKITATIHQMNCKLWFFEEVTRIFPPWDLWLVNELVEDYKEPRWLPGAYAPGAPGWTEPDAASE